MGLMDLLLRKGRGVGELKDLRNEQALNGNIIKIIKQLNDLDAQASQARNGKNYAGLASLTGQQMALIEQVHQYSMIRFIRLEYDYKEISAYLDNAEKHYNDNLKKVNEEEKKLKKVDDKQKYLHIKMHLAKTREELNIYRDKIMAIRERIKALKSKIRDGCKSKIIKIKKLYNFA